MIDNQPRRVEAQDQLRAAREYLTALESLANFGRRATDPREVMAALKTFAQPSNALKELAGLQMHRRGALDQQDHS